MAAACEGSAPRTLDERTVGEEGRCEPGTPECFRDADGSSSIPSLSRSVLGLAEHDFLVNVASYRRADQFSDRM